MNIKKIITENMHQLFYVMCSVMFSESMLLRFVGISAPLLTVISSLFFMAVTALIYFNRKNLLTYVCITAVIVVMQFLFSIGRFEFIAFADKSIKDFLTREPIETAQKIFICVLIAAVISAVFFILTKIKAVRFAVAIITVAVFILCGLKNMTANAVEIFSGTGIIIFALVEMNLFISYKKEGKGNINAVISYLVPLFLIFSIVIAAVPSSEKPIRWEAVRKLVSVVRGAVDSIVSDISFAFSSDSFEFDISMQGYSDEEGKLGGNLSESSSDNQLSIQLHKLPSSSLYLIGTVNDVYDGEGWSRSKYTEFVKADYYLDYCETLCALERNGYTEEEISKFTNRSRFSAFYDEIRTKTLFYPLKTYDITPYDNSNSFKAETPSIAFPKPKSKDMKYYISFLEIDYRSPQFIELARQGADYSENPPSSSINKRLLSDDIVEDIIKRSEYIKEKYTVLPDNITQRTYELAEEITEGCENDYDKLAAIETYLKDYTYTLTPGDIPDGYEPVDYFLFENKTGYCTYFASAMAVLARCEDIPVRCVNGFSVDYENELSSLTYGVLGSDAHAWPEAYIEGIGWIPFEPTAAYSSHRYGFHKGAVDYSDFDNKKPIIEPEPEVIEEIEEIEESEKESSISGIYIIAVVFSVVSIAVIIAAYIFIRMRIFVSRYNKCSDTDKFFTCYRMIVYICEKKRVVRGKGETADAYALKISELFGSEEISFIDITNTFDRIRYGEGNAGKAEREEIEKYLNGVIEKARKGWGKAEALIVFLGFCLG